MAWTLRSPTELAQLCLQAMGEINAVIQMPPGLTRAFGLGVANYLTTGINFPQTGTNPPVNWLAETPAHALQHLAELFGCRVVYNLQQNIVMVVPIGIGNSLPSTGKSIAMLGADLKSVAVPDAIKVVGNRTKFQARFSLMAVGEDWDGSYRPINQLTYAPREPGRKQITTITFAGNGVDFQVPQDWNLTINGVFFTYHNANGDTLATITAALLVKILANAGVVGVITATNPTASTIVLTGNAEGFAFPVIAVCAGGSNGVEEGAAANAILTQSAFAGTQGWDYCWPPCYPDVRATDRLTYAQAVALAEKSVFKYFQLINQDVSGSGTINIPGYGRLLRKQQVILTDTMVEQITPEAPNPAYVNFQDKVNPVPDEVQLQPFIVNYYNGYAKEKPFKIYGSYFPFNGATGVTYQNQNQANTPLDEIVFADATIDPQWQIVAFANPIIYVDNNRCLPAALTLETGCYIRDSETNQFVCFEVARSLGGSINSVNVEVSKRPDVELGVIGKYTFAPTLIPNAMLLYSKLQSVNILDADPIFRANFYLDGMLKKYQITNAQTIEYNGVEPIFCDGTISQVTWSIGGGSPAKTTASRNCEHSTWVPQYPTRRFAEALNPVQRALLRDAALPNAIDMVKNIPRF